MIVPTIWLEAYLGRYSNNKEPLLSCICSVVDDLTTGKVCMSVKHLLWLGVTCNRKPMLNTFNTLYYPTIFLTRRSRVLNVWSSNDITFHAPVINTCVSDKSYSVHRNPFPEYNIFRHCVRLHLALHLDVENLKSLTSCEIEPKIS